MEQLGHITSLLAKKPLAESVFELIFAKPSGYQYQAGQFCQFFIHKGGIEITRSYSIASCPDEDNLRFFIKLIPKGLASCFFAEINIGEQVEISAGVGIFVSPASFKGLTMVATGVGLSPFASILKDQLEYKKSAKEFRLLFGVRSEEDLFWQKELEELKKKHKNFSYIATLSRPGAIWHGAQGRVTDHLSDHLDTAHEFYVCGRQQMILDTQKILLENKVEPEKIHFEAF